MDRDRVTRRDALRAGVGLSVGLAGCSAPGPRPAFTDGFEDPLDDWETAAHIGPEVALSDFEWTIERSQDQAVGGDWSLELFTEGEHDDGTAWAVTEFSPPADATGFDVSFSAWSESASFNTLRNVVAYLGGERPSEEGDFPESGTSSSSANAGLREPLHRTDGWREYGFSWEPEDASGTLALAVGVTVVWEADATHYIDSVTVETR